MLATFLPVVPYTCGTVGVILQSSGVAVARQHGYREKSYRLTGSNMDSRKQLLHKLIMQMNYSKVEGSILKHRGKASNTDRTYHVSRQGLAVLFLQTECLIVHQQ